MTPRALILDEESKKKIAKVVEFASYNFFDEKEMLDRFNDPAAFPPPGDMGGYSCNIPVGFKCVFTIERHPSGWCKHLSVTIDAKDKVPDVVCTEHLARAFGMDIKDMGELDAVWLEEISPGLSAVNMVLACNPIKKDTSDVPVSKRGNAEVP